jgi:CotH kinase protein
MHLIPWDLDGAFEHIIRNANPVTPIVDKWGEKSSNCNPFFSGSSFILQKSAACDKLTATWITFNDEYLAAKKHLQNDILTNEKTMTQLDTWAKQISPFIKEAEDFYRDNKTTSFFTWENAVSNLKNQVQVAKTLEKF